MIIRRNIELEARLVDDLLDVTRISRNKLRIQMGPVDLHLILHQAFGIAAPVLREKEISTVMELASERPQLRGDAARLAQVFSNLLTNAAKFTPAGGGVTVQSALMDSKVRVTVTDTGVGIAPEVLPQIFEPFRQGETTKARRFGGLGLGLSISKGLVEAHDGTITAQSDGAGHGTTITVELPTIDTASIETGTPAPAAALAATVRPLRVLLVEDHEDTRRILGSLIAQWGHALTLASTVAEACRALDNMVFDVLLSDIGLPDGSGFDIVARLRRTSRIPAVAMSGYGMESDLARTSAAGFNEHIIKPVPAEALRDLLARLAADTETRHGK